MEDKETLLPEQLDDKIARNHFFEYLALWLYMGYSHTVSNPYILDDDYDDYDDNSGGEIEGI
jgi:hypothetical protein